MIATLCWKEYREQRGIWLAIVVVGVLLVAGVGSMANQGLWHVHEDASIRGALAFMMAGLVLLHGVVCGAQMLAGEQETGTLAFLDMLSPQRRPIWQTKLGMGCLLTLTQSQILGGWTAYFQVTEMPVPLVFALYAVFSVYGLMCGMVGGAWCRYVLLAVLTGLVLVIAGLLLVLAVLPHFWRSEPVPAQVWLAALLGLSGLAAAASWSSFCATEEPRRRLALRWTRNKACWWLAMRQGRWVIAAGLAASLAGGFMIMPVFFTLYPFASLAAGLLCGLAAFAPEQAGEQERFLGAQRFPPGRLWFHKSLFWLTASMLMTVLLSLPSVIGMNSGPRLDPASGILQDPFPARGILLEPFLGRTLLSLTMWPIYGFCFGQFFMLLSRRIIVAAAIAIFASLVVLLAWLPSFLFGGASTWQFLGVPLFLLLATRLSMWSWLCGRMYTRSHLFSLAGCALFVMVWLAGNFWYRAVEIPDVGEPFDVAAYEAELDRAARTGTANAVKKAVSEEETHRTMVSTKLGPKLGPPTKPIFPVAADKRGKTEKPPMDYIKFCQEILEKGWPKEDAEVGRWLDAMFEGAWAANLRNATNMPLGLLVDPRHVTWETPIPEIQSCGVCATLFTTRALQLQARGDQDGSLEHLGVVLALSRQLRHFAISNLYVAGNGAQESALRGFAHWLSKVGPDPKRLRNALELLLRHEKETPDVLDYLKTAYIFNRHVFKEHPFRKANFPIEERIYAEASQAPWERERRVRLLNALFLGRLTKARWSRGEESHLEELARRPENKDSSARIALAHGLPLAEGPSAALSPGRWGQILIDTAVWYLFTIHDFAVVHSAAENLRWLHADQLVTALALYEVEKGKPAAKLDDLVPDYLATIPVDPMTGKPFFYRIAADEKALLTLSVASALGTLSAPNARAPLLAASALAAGRHEELEGSFPPNPPNQPAEQTIRVLLPGQGVIWAVKDPKVGATEDSYYLVPRWRR